MSKEYDQYLVQHKENVGKGLDWLKENLPDLIMDIPGVDWEWQIKMAHDESKSHLEEYYAYDAYFYGKNRSFKVVQDFNKAWLIHIHNNPHHWQHWVLINDDPKEGEILIQMPYNYIIEMICDWWAFGWAAGDLFSIFVWYDEHKDYMKLQVSTALTVEKILEFIKDKLEEK